MVKTTNDSRTFYRLARQTSPTTYVTLDQHLQPGNQVYDPPFEPIHILNKHGEQGRGIDIIVMECAGPISDAEAIFGSGRYIIIETNQALKSGRLSETKTVQYFDEESYGLVRQRIAQAARDRASTINIKVPHFKVYEILTEKWAILEGEGSKEGVKIPFKYQKTGLLGTLAASIYEKGRGAIPRHYSPPQAVVTSSQSVITMPAKPEPKKGHSEQLQLFPETKIKKGRKVVPIREDIELTPPGVEVPF